MRVEQVVAVMHATPGNVRYSDLMKVCVHYFGQPRQRGSSHAVFKTPWPGDPRVNIQSDRQSKGLPGQTGAASDLKVGG